jgi:hypothetical protein
MASKAISDLLLKARTEPEFLQLLILDPQRALSNMQLTKAERAVLAARTPEQLLSLAVHGGEEFACDPRTCEITCQATCSNSAADICDYTAVRRGSMAHQLSEGLQTLIERARLDPSLFKKLQTNPQAVLADLPLTRMERETIGANTPNKLLELLFGIEPRVAAGCGGGGTCGYTCSMTCSGNYTMSCGSSCANTCGYTAAVE